MRVTGDSKLSILWDQTVHAFGGFGYFNDIGLFYRAPLSMVDHLSLIPFLLGLAYALYKILDERYMLLLMIFVAVTVTGGVLTIEAPSVQRLVGATPAVVIFIAIGVKLITDAVSKWRPQMGVAVAGIAVAALFTTNVHFYFTTYRTGNYYSDENTRIAVQVADYAKTLPEDTRIFFYGANKLFLAGWGHPAMTFWLRDYPRFDVFEDGERGVEPGTAFNRRSAIGLHIPAASRGRTAACDAGLPGRRVQDVYDRGREGRPQRHRAGRRHLRGLRDGHPEPLPPVNRKAAVAPRTQRVQDTTESED